MRLFSFRSLQFLLILLLAFCFNTGFCQDKYESISFKIDSFASVGLPQSALKEVDRLEKLARDNKNAPQQIRAVIYRMTFQSYLEQEAIEDIVARLKTDIEQAKYPVKPVLQSLLAEMYWKYYQQNRYRFSERTHQLKADSDFTEWDLQTIINETGKLYRLSLSDIQTEQGTPVSVLDGALEGDKNTSYLRPTLYDLLLQRALDFYLSEEPALTKPQLPFSINNPAFFSDSRTFVALPVKTTDTASTFYQGIKFLQQATAFHLKAGNEEALADVDLQRLKFLYSRSTVNNKDSLYLSALKQIAVSFANKPISSEAIVLQGQYYQGIDSLTIAYSYFKQAAAAYPESMGGKNAVTFMAQLEEKNISATLENDNMPGKPLLALLNYQNITSAKVVVYRLPFSQIKNYRNNDLPDGQKGKLTFLATLKAVKSYEYQLPGKKDYRRHTAEFKLDPLPPGNYVIMVKDGASNETTLTGLTTFRVSSIAYVTRLNPDNKVEVRVMDRGTGMPLNKVNVALTGTVNHYDSSTRRSTRNEVSASGITGENGLFTTDKFTAYGNVSIELRINGDTLHDESKYINGTLERDNDDDEPVDRTVLFTDRQIYRPGQTIYFKALQLQTFKGKSKIIPGKAIKIDFRDANQKEVSALNLTTNEFGTVSGSFIIPQSMLDGNAQIQTADGEISIRIEEYKRPTFQVEFLPVKESHKLNDSVSIKGTVTAFSGYGLSRAKLAYHITRNEYFDYGYARVVYGAKYRYNSETAEIATDTLTTDDQGNYTIKFKAIPGNNDGNELLNYRYNINADVTDASGETHSAQTNIIVGNNDIAIVDYLPAQVFAKDTTHVLVKLNNLNGQAQKGNINVEIYSLKSPGHLFKSRLWQAPEQYLLSKDEFKTAFPDYAYNKEDAYSSWPVVEQVLNADIKIDEKPGLIDLEALRKEPSGEYRVVIKARNEHGDTTSVIKYINLVSTDPKPTNFTDWVVPVLNSVKPGEKAEFLVGAMEPVHVLAERYEDSKLISSKWISIEKGQQSIKFPIGDKDKNTVIQFMMVYQNRFYSSYQKIYLAKPDEELKMKFLTFRDRLQPGEEEQWKLQITNQGNEAQSAEMVAGLYDASLDDITSPQSWQNILDEQERYRNDYFMWNAWGFVNAINTVPVSYRNRNYDILTRDYERIDLLGYNYYGGYNYGYQQYLNKVKLKVSNAEMAKQLQANYLKNAAKIKNGYDVTGFVKASDDGEAIPGVTIKIKGTSIGTQTDAKGYFKIRVPVNGILLISFVGYKPKEIGTTQTANLTVRLTPAENQLNEVVVGYSTVRKTATLGYATVNIRGNSQYKGYSNLDGAIYGSAAGVAVLNPSSVSEEKVVRREIRTAGSKPIAVRKNFNETAFFYPQLRTDEKGQVLIEFTIPEALTKWRFKAFAHTKDLHAGYIESDVVTQKQLSVSANTPRFLREGDTITISARLANLTAGKLKGQVKLQLFNALNMQPVSLLLNSADAKQQFEVPSLTNKAVSFKMMIPQGLDAITYRLTAEAGSYSDGEENTIPVLPNRMLVTESLPMMIRAGQSKTFTFDKLLNNTSNTLKSKTLTLEYTQNPAWYAVQALSYMMEFPYECSEQVFSRYYANSLATSLVNRMPVIKQVFDQWKSSNSPELLSNLEKNQELKSTLLEETPWLQDAVSESEQKKRIALLFDLNKMSNELQLNLDKLQKKQLPDGGFPWFGGEQADRYITQHVLAGIGQLYHLHIADEKDVVLKGIADEALRYLDNKLIEDDRLAKKQKGYGALDLSSIEIHAWYARSYYTNKSMSGALKVIFKSYLGRAEKQWVSQDPYEQGLIALTMLRNGKPLVAKAIIRSLLETAYRSDDMGMYWSKNQAGYYWYQSPIETQCLLIELFTEAGGNDKAVEEMKIWLLRNKQTSNWKTTKATAAACYALLSKSNEWLSAESSSEIKLDGKLLNELKPEIKTDAGTGYMKTNWTDEQVKPGLGKVEIKNNGKSVSWGAMYWQYLEQLDKITPSQTDIHIMRKYFIVKQTPSGQALTEVDASHQPVVGDLLKVVVNLKAGRDFEYVQLKDMRPAGTEPVDALSEYKYQDGLYYYQVTKDVATNFFISEMSKGTYVFEYQLRVAQPGNFSTGISTVQSMYAPEFNSHSESKRVTFKP